MATTLTVVQVRDIAQAIADGATWPQIGETIGTSGKTARTMFLHETVDLGLYQLPGVAQAIPRDLPAAIANLLTAAIDAARRDREAEREAARQIIAESIATGLPGDLARLQDATRVTPPSEMFPEDD